MKKFPISKAKELLKEYDYDKIIIVCINDTEEEASHITAYGKTKALCKEASETVDKIAETLGWIEQ